MPKLLFLVTEDWFFVSHFLPMARTARAMGLEVVVATRVGNHAAAIEAEGARVVPIGALRGGFSPQVFTRSVPEIRRVLARERPDILHCIALPAIVAGGLAARGAGVPGIVLAPTGLGFLWTDGSVTTRIARAGIRHLVGRVLRGPNTHYLFENHDDPRAFGLDPHAGNVTIVGGAGVRPEDFAHAPPPPSPPLRVAVVARMLAIKGIAEAVDAVRRARAKGADVTLDLYGAPDAANPRALTEAQLRDWSAESGIMWHGPTRDVAQVWREHHVAMLLSRGGEGVPRSLIEAAASGRPIVTTDVPGCRELVRDGREGFVVPPGDAERAATALMTLAGDAALRARMGEAAHAHFLLRFTEQAVTSALAGLYWKVIDRT